MERNMEDVQEISLDDMSTVTGGLEFNTVLQTLKNRLQKQENEEGQNRGELRIGIDRTRVR